LKIDSSKEKNKRSISDFLHCKKIFKDVFIDKRFYTDISYLDWENAAQFLWKQETYRGSVKNKVKRSVSTLRRLFANASSCVSHAIQNGINLENHPLKVISSLNLNKCYAADLDEKLDKRKSLITNIS
jgi:hypothetical protein